MNDDLPTHDTHRRDERLQALSSLMDGAAAPADAGRACAAWRDAAQARAAWHAYHVIGDVLRSDELGEGARRDARFLAALREKLASEPIVIAPQVADGARPAAFVARRRGWAAPMAVAAGFVAVAGALVVTRVSEPGPASRDVTIAATREPALSQAAARPVAVVANASIEAPSEVVANGKLIRDVRLDQYLAAHKQFGGSSALGVPSGFLRSATFDAAER